MKRHLLKALCAVLSVCLLLTGCGGGGESDGGKGNKPMGRYVEEQLLELANLGRTGGIQMLEDGSLSFYAYQMDETGNLKAVVKNVLSPDGKDVQTTEVEWLSDLMQKGGNPANIAAHKNGDLYILYQDTNGQYAISKSTDGKTFTQIPVADWAPSSDPSGESENGLSVGQAGSADEGGFSFGAEGQMLIPSDLQILDNGDFLVSYYNGDASIQQYSGTDGSRVKTFPGGLSDIAVYGNRLVTKNSDFTKILEYDLETGKLVHEYTYDGLSWDTVLGVDKDGIYAVDNSGLSRITDGGSIWERIIDGSLTSMSIPTLRNMGVVSDEKGVYYGIFLSQEDGAKLQIMKYAYSADTPTNPDTELTLFGLQENATVRLAIGIFQRQNPNVRINYRVAMDDESSATIQDVIKALNTELLAGKAPDLLLLDGLPANSYIDKGVLLDISDLMKELTQSENLMPSILKTYEKDGKTYAAPTRYTIPVMIGDKSVMDTFQNLTGLAEKATPAKEGETQDFRTPDSVMSQTLLEEYYAFFVNSWLNGKEIDEEKLTSFLSGVQTLYQNAKPQGGEDQMMGGIIVSSSSGGGGEILTLGSYDVGEGRAKTSIEQINGLEGCRYILHNLQALENMGIRSLFNQNEFTPVGSVGIVASGKQQDVAKAFLRTLFSQKVQNWNMGDGLPVNRNSFEKNYQEMAENGAEGGGVLDDLGLRQILDNLDKPILVDQVIKEMVLNLQSDLLNGKITPEEAAKKIVADTELYRSE